MIQVDSWLMDAHMGGTFLEFEAIAVLIVGGQDLEFYHSSLRTRLARTCYQSDENPRRAAAFAQESSWLIPRM